MNHDMITDQMIAMVNRNADIRAFERRLRRICAKRKKVNHVPKVPRLRRKP